MEIKYPLVRNPYLRKYLYGYDFGSSLLILRNCTKHKRIQRLLLRNPGALGDVLYTLRLIRAIKQVNPDIFIGVLIGSWALPLAETCLDVDAIHIEDHWAVNRSNMRIWKKFYHWLDTRYKVVKELKQNHYDMAIDLYYYYPSAASLLWQAGIPERIGYDSHEGSAFYTNVVRWENIDVHNIEYQEKLVLEASISVYDLSSSHINLNFPKYDIDLLQTYSLVAKKYFVISVGTGDVNREWPLEKWRILLKYLNSFFPSQQINFFVFVGMGKREYERILALLESIPDRGISLCNRLSIPELMQIIRNARVFIGLESFAGHIAAMYKVPQVSIMHGATRQRHWEPFSNPYCTVVRKNIECSPCYFPSQCQYQNACMEISAEIVLQKVKEKF